MTPVTVFFHNGPHTSAWEGYLEQGVIRFDYTNARGPRRFFVMPDRHVMFADESHLPQVRPDAHWYVHIVDAFEYDRRIWWVEDREIDIVVEGDLSTCRAVDLDDFGEALEDGRISVADARRILTGTPKEMALFAISFPNATAPQRGQLLRSF